MWFWRGAKLLFYFSFLVDDILPDYRVEFFNFQLIRHSTLIFGRCVEMTGPCGGHQPNLFSYARHNQPLLYPFTAGAHIRQDLVDPEFIDNPQPLVADPQLHPAVFTVDPEAPAVEIGQETAPGLVMGMGNIVPGQRPFSGNLAHS
jgi:hypothetical protein